MPKCQKCGTLTKPSVACACEKAAFKLSWKTVRAKIKPWFLKAGIDKYCELRLEGCTTLGDGYAHTKKQRWLTAEGMYIVAFLCNECHNKIEGHRDMENIILGIRQRNTIPEIDRIINEYYRDQPQATALAVRGNA